MDEQTVRALNAINRSFYSTCADEFDATRSDPWPGWTPLMTVLSENTTTGQPLRVLDVGCGNGRFGAFLADHSAWLPSRIHYTGIDSSALLLERARARELPFASIDLRRADLVDEFESALPEDSYQLIALFGVLHHVPSCRRRREFLLKLGERLAPGGLIAVTSWQFEAFERFRAKFVSWDDYNETAQEPIDLTQLEPGDHVLPWGDRGDTFRYCHFTDESELWTLLKGLSFELVASYTADGREQNLNRYFICRFSNRQITPMEEVASE